MPTSKRINYALLISECSAEYVTAMNNAYTYVSNNLSLQGFTVTKSSGGIVGSTPGVGAIVSAAPCSPTAHGNLCKFHDPISTIFTSRVNTFLAGVIDQSKRNALIEDQFRHEMLHAAGLGHDLCGGEPVTSLMNRPSSCQNTSNPQSWALANLVKFERDILFSYKP